MSPQNRDSRTRQQLLAEIEGLQARLTEAEDTLRAIREGEVDAIVVSGSRGEQVFSLTGSEQVYRLIVETMHEAALTVSLDGRVLFCNRQLTHLLRLPAERVVGRRLEELVLPEARREVAPLLANSRSAPVTQRLVFQAADGTPVPAHTSTTLLHTPEGESICLVATDLSEMESSAEVIRQLHSHQEALRQSEQRWVTTLSSIGDAVIASDTSGRITFMNPVAQELIGWTLAEAAGRPVKEVFRIVNEQTRAEVEDPVCKVLESGRIAGLANHTLLIRKDGAEVAIDDSGAPIQTEDGTLLGVVLVFRDIRGRRQTEEQLRLAKEAAESASRAKSEFLAHMSHEIRTPLSAIIGLAEVLEPRLREEQNRQFVSLIHESARSMLSLLGDILDLSRIESGKVELHPAPFELHRMLEKLVESHRLLARRKGLTVELEVDEELPAQLEGDVELLSRVLQNLLSNAVKYTERGEVRLAVRRWTGGRVDRRLWAFFSVADTGIGIPGAARPRLFESFQRLHGSLTHIHHEGTGLGLVIAKQLVERMGGEIGVESTEGAGSTFYFRLPFGRSLDTGEAEEAAGEPASALQPLGALPPLRVLLAEDNRMNRVFLQTAFQDGGHRVTAVEDGRRALEALEGAGQRFDVVLMDIQMPRLDGLEVIRALRAMEGATARLPVIALTAFAARGDERRFREAGADGYVSKPVDFERLAGEIRRVITGRRE